jgi:tetratricopeptide (TPR) repeat protein
MKAISCLLLLLYPFFTTGQDAAVLLKEAEKLETAPAESAALEKYKEVLKIAPNDVYALSKCSELCSRIGNRQADAKTRDNYYAWAKNYASAALKINSNSSEANCAMAIALGRMALTKSSKEKLNSAKLIKQYVDIALQQDAANYKAWHVLGKWHYELSILNMLERTIVKVFFGGLPKASLQEAVNAYEQARKLSPGFVMNYLEQAKAYKAAGEKEKAIAALNTMLTLPNRTEDDAPVKEAGKKLLKQWL